MNPGIVSQAQKPPPTFSLPDAAAATIQQLAKSMIQIITAIAVGLVVDVIATAQAAVKSGCAEGDFLD